MAPTRPVWTTLIDELCAGEWHSPLTGKQFPPAPFERIVIEEDLSGREADLVSALGFEPPFAVVGDANTLAAMGDRVAHALGKIGAVEIVTLEKPHCNMATVRALRDRLRGFPSVVAVGSGTINDLCKYATYLDERPYCVFATAASMNGYVSSTASVTLDSRLKVSLPAQMPRGFFVDLKVCAEAPAFLGASGFGDCLCRSVAQVDWWMSHRLLGTPYMHEPYVIEIPDEIVLMERAAGIKAGDIEAIGSLIRVLTLCGIGVSFTGVSNHGSMGEHQISHYLDCFAGDAHPGSLHGQQVGVATLTMARIQAEYLDRTSAPQIAPTIIDEDGMRARMGEGVAADCIPELRKKSLDAASADAFNARLKDLWPQLRVECLDAFVPAETLAGCLRAAGGLTTATDLGFPVPVYREAVTHAHEMRNRFSFTDIAVGAGDIERLASHET